MSDELIVAETLRADVVFAPGGVDAILENLERDVRAVPTDISTKAGRAACTSLARKVASSKTALDELGRNLVAEWKQRSAAVDAERRRIRERLDDLRDEVRRPLTEWEETERRRVEGHEAALKEIERIASFLVAEPGSQEIAGRIVHLNELPPREWHEFAKRAVETTAQVRASLQASHVAAIRREAERAELVRLRKEAEERAQRERDEQLQREAAERARLAAEAEAREAARRAHEAYLLEQARIENEKIVAMRDAEKARRDAEEVKLREQAAAEKAEQDRIAADEKARRDAEVAVEAERRRVAEEAAAARAEQERREADEKHREKINAAVRFALLNIGVSKQAAVLVVAAIVAGNVPHVKIVY